MCHKHDQKLKEMHRNDGFLLMCVNGTCVVFRFRIPGADHKMLMIGKDLWVWVVSRRRLDIYSSKTGMENILDGMITH